MSTKSKTEMIAHEPETEAVEDVAIDTKDSGASELRGSDGVVDLEAVIAEIERDFPATPIDVLETPSGEDFFKIKLPYPYNEYLHYEWPIFKGEAGQRDMARCSSRGYTPDLPKAVYEANKTPFDAPWGTGAGKNNRIIRGDNILVVCRKELAIERHKRRMEMVKSKYAPYQNKVINAGLNMTESVENKRDADAEKILREQNIAKVMREEKMNRSKT